MSKVDIKQLSDDQKAKLVEARWSSSDEIWKVVGDTYKQNTAIYENKAEYISSLPQKRRQSTVQANRIFVNQEAVINSLIANPPGINIIAGSNCDCDEGKEFARKTEAYFRKKFVDRNFKETLRMGLRNLYFGRLLVIKPFWNPKINDFDFRAIDPRKLRVAKYARKEQDSEFSIEEVPENLCAIIDRFPAKKAELMKKYGFTDENEMAIKNPDVTYKEAWIDDYIIFKLENIILDTIKNPYFDYDGIYITDEEFLTLEGDENGDNKGLSGQKRREFLQQIKLEQPGRAEAYALQETVPDQPPIVPPQPIAPQEAQPQGVAPVAQQTNGQPPAAPQAPAAPQPDQNAAPVAQPSVQPAQPVQYRKYTFNFFDNPRKAYIIATIFNNENSPIGRTDMITLAAPLQRGIDKRKMDIDENCELANGILKVDASVMGKSDAQRIRFETKGVIWGKGVKDGVTRETGQALPAIVFQDMLDSREEIDNIMAATSAFKGQQEGVETKAGRLALIQQSYLRLNELVQVVDYVSKEAFEWAFQMAKTRYTEYHYANTTGKDSNNETIELIQDDFIAGSEVTIIAGKSLPVDDEYRFEQAQNDVAKGYISPIDYLTIAKYDNAKELSKNAVLYHLSPVSAVGVTPEELQNIPVPLPVTRVDERVMFADLPSAAKVQVLARMGITISESQVVSEGSISPVSIAFKDLPPDGQLQAAAKIGIILDPAVTFAEHAADNAQKQGALNAKIKPTAPQQNNPMQMPQNQPPAPLPVQP